MSVYIFIEYTYLSEYCYVIENKVSIGSVNETFCSFKLRNALKNQS